MGRWVGGGVVVAGWVVGVVGWVGLMVRVGVVGLGSKRWGWWGQYNEGPKI